MGALVWIFLVGALGGLTAGQRPPGRLCVDAEHGRLHCSGLELDTNLGCVLGRDKVDCMRQITDGNADLMEVDEQDVYLAGRWFDLAPVAMQIYSGRSFRYEAIVLVKNDLNLESIQDLKNRRACFTGVGRTVGWEVPLAVLREEGALVPQPYGDLASAAAFFGSSCAPGNWSSDPETSNYLKERYPSLHALCPDPQEYAGYEGALRCLAEGLGDVAFTKVDALEEYRRSNSGIDTTARYLCVDGTTRGLDEQPCVWGQRPSPAFVARAAEPETQKNMYVQELERIFGIHGDNRPSWFNTIFVSNGNRVTGVRNTVGQTYQSYLGRYMATIEKPDYGQLRWCVTSDEEEAKCRDFSAAAYTRRVRPVISCERVASQSRCVTDGPDIVALDGGDVYTAGRYQGFVPVASEIYGHSDNSYYSVAVIRAGSNITSLADIRGQRSCHTGLGRTAGWLVPVGTLIDMELLPDGQCDREVALAEFVRAACVPGSHVHTLCSQCIGDDQGNHRCARNSAERYNGYGGALRCLAENAGDVAFVKHSTVREFADGASDETWAAGLRSQDFRLLCRYPGQQPQPVDNYEKCNLASNPAHYVMVRGDVSPDQHLTIAAMLADISRKFSSHSQHFKLFAPYDGVSDLLFKDYATSLRPVKPGTTYRQALGEDFFKASEALDSQQCQQQSI